MPASTLHPMTDVAKPVIDCAAICAHAGDCAVITTRAARMPKASANVSTILTPFRPLARLMPALYVLGLQPPLRSRTFHYSWQTAFCTARTVRHRLTCST